MTITYTAEVATCRGFGCFLKLLLRWRGSIYKLVWLDLLAFLFFYYVLSIVYRFALNEAQKETFEAFVVYFDKYSESIPLSFVLGFYVTVVMTRWWNQYTTIPWPDTIAVFVSSNVHGQDERGRVMRRTVMRYVCLCQTMVLAMISPRVKKRFPTLNHFMEAGLLNENEKSIIDSMNKSFPRPSKHWLPIVWAASIITRARKEGRIRDDFAVKTIIDELNKFRGQCGLLISYDTISVPLVYTQVVTLAVYSYFMCCIMGQQWTEGKLVGDSSYLNKVDLYFPVFTTLKFFFYMGWLKVAESLINPFGEDDDDFEVNWMIDRNLQVSYLIVDEMHHDHPELIKDQYWDEVFPNELPYTVASERFRENHPEPSTAKIEVPKAGAMSTTMSGVRIDEMVGNVVTRSNSRNTADALDSSGNPRQTINYEFPKSAQEEEADDASGIHFTAGNGKVRLGSSPSLASLAGTISRVNTVTSALKRFLSREDSRAGSTTPVDEQQRMRFPGSASTASLVPPSTSAMPPGAKAPASMRIADQVIEEVDEQATITSQRVNDISRPDVRDIFASSSPWSQTPPIDIPARGMASYSRQPSQNEPSLFPPGGVDALLSTSAPTRSASQLRLAAMAAKDGTTMPTTPTDQSTKSLYDRGANISQEVVNGDTEARTVQDGGTGVLVNPTPIVEHDEFEKLRAERDKERMERQKKNLALTIGTAPVIDPTSAAAILPAVAAALMNTTTAPLTPVPLHSVASNAELLPAAVPLDTTPKPENTQ